MVRCASGVTQMRHRAVPKAASAPVAANPWKATPAARMSWAKTAPNSSSATRPMNAAEIPSDANPAAVFAADPPEISTAGGNAA